MEINHCYPDSSDSGLRSTNQRKHLRSPCAAFCKMSWGCWWKRRRWGDSWCWWWVCACVWVGGGAALEEMIISTSHQCASALHKPPRAVSKCCWQIKAIKERWVGWSPVYYPSHRAFTPSPAHQCEIMVFAFICPRSIFQTSDKRGNWTGNRPKCCKSTKHNYQKALKLPNRIHILKWSNGCPPAIMRVPPPLSFDHGAVPPYSQSGQWWVPWTPLPPPREAVTVC